MPQVLSPALARQTVPVDDSTRLHARVADALAQLDRLSLTTAWTTPRDLAGHRAELSRRLTEHDRSPYRRPIEFPDADSAPIEGAAEGVLETAEHLDEPLRALVEDEVRDTVETVRAIASRDDARLAAWVQRHAPASHLVAEAQRILDQPGPDPEPAHVSAHQVADMLQVALTNYGLDDWSIDIAGNMAAKASVKRSASQLRIRADATFSEAGARRIVVHEFGGHVLRWANAEAQPEPLAARPLGRTVPTEEGLAVLLEEQLGVATHENLRTYALRVIAVDAAQHHGLLDLAFLLADLMPPDAAAELAIRTRRGFTNPDNPGGQTKDTGYLEGLLQLRTILAEAPDDIVLLRGTKWAFEHLPLIRDLAAAGRLTPPGLTPDLGRLGLA